VFNRGFSGGYLLCNEVMQREYAESRGLPIGKAVSMGGKMAFESLILQEGDGITLYKDDRKVGGFEVKDLKEGKEGRITEPPFPLKDGEYDAFKTKDREFDSIEKTVSSLRLEECSGSRRKLKYRPPAAKRRRGTPDLSFYLSSLKSLDKVIPFAQRVYFEWNRQFQEARERCLDSGVEFVLMMPRVSPQVHETEENALMVNSPGQAWRYRSRRLYGSYFMNLFNSLTIPSLFQYTLSVELAKDDIADLTRYFPGRVESMVFGRLELMVTKDPTLREGVLVDERGKRFPVYRDHFGYGHILNSSDLFLLDFLDELECMGVDSFGIDLRRRSPELSELVAKAFCERDLSQKSKLKRRCGSITAGHYLRGVD
jgi:putative protease